MLMLTGKVHDLRHFGLGHFESIDPAFANAMIMDMQHDAGSGFAVLLENRSRT